jgi:arylsulfatase A-like enzyme
VDILPTLLQLTGHPIPDWIEGRILPPFSSEPYASDRSVFVVEAKSNPKTGPLRKATVGMIKENKKLVYYRGYEGYDNVFELYDLTEDPEEMENLYNIRTDLASAMREELLEKIDEKDAPFL